MSHTGHLPELDSLRSQVADLSRGLAERDCLVQDLWEQFELLRAIVEGTAAETGEEFLATLVTHLTAVLHVKYALIGEVQGDRIKKIRTLAVSAGGVLVDNFDYELADTPCATALTQSFTCFDRDVQATFPQFQRLADLGAESYCAVPIWTKGGAAVGLLVVMDTKPLEHRDFLPSLLGVFAPRIAAEFERRRAEQERAQALADLHNVIETIPDIVFALDTQGNVVKWNQRLGDVTGYSPEELLNKPALAFVPPEEQARTAAAIQRVFVEGYAELEGHLLTKAHRLIPYHWTGALLKNRHGEPVGITGIGRDVSEQKRAEEALRRSEERFALAVEGSNDIFWDAHRLPAEPWYAPQTPVWWSPLVRELLGLQEADQFETFEQWAVRLHPADKDRVFGQLAAHIEQRVPYDVEYRLRTNAGDYCWIRGRGQALWDEQGEPSRMSGSCQDITERKMAEEALRASEERWQLAVRGSNGGIWDWDIQSGTVFFSPRWNAMRGFGEYEIPSCVEEWQSRIHPDDLGRVLQSLDAYMAKQTPEFCEEYRTQRKDGSYMWILDRGVALWANDGRPIRMVGSESDITEHKQALLRLTEQESLLRAILDTEPECVHREADDGTILQMNKAGLCFIESDSLEQAAGRSVYDLVAPEFLEQYRRMHEAVIRGASQRLEFQIVGLKGTRRWMETHAEPLRNPVDHRMEHLAITRDITEHKRAETELRESEERYRTLVDLSPNGVLVYSNGKKVYVNQAACRIMGAASPEQLLDNPTVHFSHPDDHESIHASIAQILATGEPVPRVERKYQRLDGAVIFVEVDAGRIMWNGAPAIQVSFADITERKRVEEERQKQEVLITLMLNTGPACIKRVAADGSLLHMNPTGLKLVEACGEPEVVGRSVFELIAPEHRDAFISMHRRVIEGHECTLQFEVQGLKRTRRWMESYAVPFQNPVTGQTEQLAVTHDITERKQAEKALRESEAFNISVLNSLSSQIVVLNSQGVIMAVNKPWLRFAEENGAPQLVESFVGMSYLNVCAQAPLFANGEEAASAEAGILAVLAGTHNEFTLEYPCHSPDQQRWFRMRVTPLLDSPAGVVVVHENITERKQAEEALRVSEGHFRAIFENTAVGIAFGSHTTGTGISEANPAFQSMTGYSLEELCRLGIKGLTYSDDIPASMAFMQQLVSGALVHGTIEKRYLKKDGSIMWAETTVSSILDEQGGYENSVAMIQDITQRKVNEQLLAVEKRVLELIATDAPLQEILTLMCQASEELSPGVHCSILLLDRDGLHLRHGAAPSLPEVYVHAIDGLAIGPAVGSCGTAAFTRRQVIVSNIAEDPLWTGYRDLALGHGLKACWSTPVISFGGAVLGTFALYYGEPQQPTRADLRLIERVAHFACIAIERKQTEEALRKSEERYARATAVGKVGVWELDVATGTCHGDPNMKALFGYADDELSTDPLVWLNLVHSDDQSIAMDHWQRIVNGETDDSNYELRMLKKDGTVIWTDVRGHAVRDHEGQVTQVFGATVDITERKQVQDALAQSEHQLRTVLDALPVGVWFTDRLGRPLLANPMAKRILSNIKQIGLQHLDNAVSWWETAEPAIDPHRRALSHALRTGVPALNETLELECLDGRKKIIRNSTVPVKNESGTIMGAVVLNEDITLLRVAQEALELTKFSVDCAIEGFFWIGPDARILNVNEAACRMLEYTSEELTSMTVYDIDPNVSPEVWLTHWKRLTEKGSFIFESKYWSRTGRVLRTEVTVNYLRYEGNEYGCAIIRDIEPRKRADAALRASEERYRDLYNETPTMYFTLATDGTVRSVNRFGAEQLGYRVEELVGRSVLDLVHEDDKETVAASLSECLATPMITRYWEFRKIGKGGNIIWVRETVRVDQSSVDEPTVLVTCEDITERKQAEDIVQHRLEFERLIASLSTHFVNVSSIDQDAGITEALCSIGKFIDVDRSYVFLFRNNGRMVDNTHEWYADGTEPQIDHLQDLPTDAFPWIMARHQRGEVTHVVRVADLPPEANAEREEFEREGIQSLVTVPIISARGVIGFVGFDLVREERTWDDDDIALLKIVGEMLAGVIERKRGEEALRVSREMLQQALQASNTGLWGWNTETNEVSFSREWKRQLGYEESDLADAFATWEAHLHPDDHDRAIAFVQSYLANPIGDYQQEFRLRHKDGTYRWIEARASVVTEPDGRRVRLLGSHTDITERKRAEQEQVRLIEELTRSQQHFQSLFNWTPSAVGISTVAEGRFIDVNEGFSRLTGYTREEVIGHTTLELGLWADPLERKPVFREIMEQGYLHNREGRLRTKSGEIRSLMVSVESIQLGSIPCLIYLCHDITERKRMEDALRMRERELQAALQERERISQDLHDGILQSLFAVGLNLEVTKSSMPPKTRKMAGGSLDKSIDQLNRVMREIRNFIGRLDLDLFEGKDLPTALQRALKSLTENQATRVRLAVENRAAKAVSVEQSLHLFHVIQEAVSNCIRHGGAQEARVSLKMLKQGVRLSIRDNGRGFNPHVAKGVGHGLANMAARARKIGGRFTILSKENEGTRIILDLPKEAPHFPD